MYVGFQAGTSRQNLRQFHDDFWAVGVRLGVAPVSLAHRAKSAQVLLYSSSQQYGLLVALGSRPHQGRLILLPNKTHVNKSFTNRYPPYGVWGYGAYEGEFMQGMEGMQGMAPGAFGPNRLTTEIGS